MRSLVNLMALPFTTTQFSVGAKDDRIVNMPAYEIHGVCSLVRLVQTQLSLGLRRSKGSVRDTAKLIMRKTDRVSFSGGEGSVTL